MSRNTIEYNVCRENLGDDTTGAQYAAYKARVRAALTGAFPGAEIVVGDSSFCNDSTCSIGRDCGDVTRDDVETVVQEIGESWWDAE
jgi:hypothetical protein